MTPTEQDKELDKILDVLIDSVVEARMKWHKQSQRARQDQSMNSGFTQYQSELKDADNTAKNAIKKLFTADRKRVALEARIHELEQLIPEPIAEMVSIDYEDELKRLYDDIHNRIAKLKAQQEEQNNDR